MDIEIRRNRDLVFTIGPENERALKESGHNEVYLI